LNASPRSFATQQSEYRMHRWYEIDLYLCLKCDRIGSWRLP
jgi:hypothetical protein